MTIVQPAPIAVTVRFPQATIAIRPHLWLKGAKLAVRQEQRAKEARYLGSTTTPRYAYALGQEVEESIQAIAAVRHCLHNLWRVWRDDINRELSRVGQQNLTGEGALEPRHFTSDLPADLAEWSANVLLLIGQRNEAVHHDEETAPAVPHPYYTTNVAGVERVSHARL